MSQRRPSLHFTPLFTRRVTVMLGLRPKQTVVHLQRLGESDATRFDLTRLSVPTLLGLVNIQCVTFPQPN